MAEEQEPTLEVKKRMIEQKRDQFRAAGFDATLEAISMNAQKAVGAQQERERMQIVSDFRAKAANSYLAAKEMDALLAQLPEPEKKPE